MGSCPRRQWVVECQTLGTLVGEISRSETWGCPELSESLSHTVSSTVLSGGPFISATPVVSLLDPSKETLKAIFSLHSCLCSWDTRLCTARTNSRGEVWKAFTIASQRNMEFWIKGRMDPSGSIYPPLSEFWWLTLFCFYYWPLEAIVLEKYCLDLKLSECDINYKGFPLSVCASCVLCGGAAGGSQRDENARSRSHRHEGLLGLGSGLRL